MTFGLADLLFAVLQYILNGSKMWITNAGHANW